MKSKHNWVALILAVALIGMAAGTLCWFRTHHKLGKPGIIVTEKPGTVVVDIDLPATVLDYVSTNVPQAAEVTNTLPPDTSYAQRRYFAPDQFWVNANIVLMGTDRTSIHKPEYCLPGQGFRIVSQEIVNIPVAGPESYTLPVAKWLLHVTEKLPDGSNRDWSGFYVFWFVADKEQTTSHWERIRWLASDLLRTGVLQRWAYVSYFTICRPGEEAATFERVRELIAASVPELQKPLPTAQTTTVARQ